MITIKARNIGIAAVAASFVGVLGIARVLHAQAVSEPQVMTVAQPQVAQAQPQPMRAPSGPAVGGTIVVTRLSDTTFVVVKDLGDQQMVTLFSTEGGLLTKKHAGKFLY